MLRAPFRAIGDAPWIDVATFLKIFCGAPVRLIFADPSAVFLNPAKISSIDFIKFRNISWHDSCGWLG
jgi:hypothetical protein